MRNTPEEAAENVQSVRRVPRSMLPDGPARDALLALAAAGRDCYCYASGGETSGTWCVWLGDLADARRPERNGRVPLIEWGARWRELLVEMHLSNLSDLATAQPGHDDGLEVWA